MRIISMLIVMIILGIAPLGAEPADRRISTNTVKYKGAEYRIVLTESQCSSSANFDINNSTFPKPLDVIINIAKKQVNKIDSDASWSFNNLNLNQNRYDNNTYWYYQINFRGAENGYATILVTLDGVPCKIINVQETTL